MKVSLAWLATFVDLPAQAELEERLTLAGLEIEGVLRTGPDLSAIRVGHVLERRAASECRAALGVQRRSRPAGDPSRSCVVRPTSPPARTSPSRSRA